MNALAEHRVSIVIPVYRGEMTLPTLIGEIGALTNAQTTPDGNRYFICEVVVVHDCGLDNSDKVIESLTAQYPFVRPVWLTRNYGQHAATLAGMASATGDWVATIDEDGQQDPRDIGLMLDTALAGSLQLVYAQPTNPPPHSRLRNALSYGKISYHPPARQQRYWPFQQLSPRRRRNCKDPRGVLRYRRVP